MCVAIAPQFNNSASASNAHSCTLTQAQLNVAAAQGFKPDESPWAIVYDMEGAGTLRIIQGVGLYFRQGRMVYGSVTPSAYYMFTYTGDTWTWYNKSINRAYVQFTYNYNTQICTSVGISYEATSEEYTNRYAVVYPFPITPTASGGGLTEKQIDTFGAKYIEPAYKVIGAGVAIVILYTAYAFALKPWIRRFR